MEHFLQSCNIFKRRLKEKNDGKSTIVCLKVEKLKHWLWSTLYITKPFLTVINIGISFPKGFVAVMLKIGLRVGQHSIGLELGVNVCLLFLSSFR